VILTTFRVTDVDDNAAMVNALQRHASVIVQKSLAEGFGLTVAEGMWKGRPVVGSAVGGIQDQVADGTGILLPDPTDLPAFGRAVRTLLDDPELAARLGTAAREYVRAHYVGDQHLLRYAELSARCLPANVCRPASQLRDRLASVTGEQPQLWLTPAVPVGVEEEQLSRPVDGSSRVAE
jgi:Glycosyl transferases group 1